MAASEKDLLLLSRYLVGGLTDRQARQLETRLASDSKLASALADLKHTRSLLKWLPEKQPQRSFILKPNLSPRPKVTVFFPALRIASAVCGLLFAFSLGIRLLPSFSAADSRVLQSVPNQSQQAMGESSIPPAAAPKMSVLADGELTPTSETMLGALSMAAGAGAPETTTAPVQQPAEEDYITTQPAETSIAKAWQPLAWIMGSLTVVLLFMSIVFYYREHL